MSDQKTTMRRGDAVVTASGRVALLVGFTPAAQAVLQFVNNGPRRYFDPATLRRAGVGEIDASGLAGVGCNQAS